MTQFHRTSVLILGCALWTAGSAQAQAVSAARAATETAIARQLAGKQVGPALAEYDRFIKASGRQDDVALLAPVAKAILQEAANASTSTVRILALERLSAEGDAVSNRALRQAATGAGAARLTTVQADSALARAGDGSAVDRLIASLSSSDARPDKTTTIGALVSARAQSAAPVLLSLLDDQNPQTREAAVMALGELDAREAIPRLSALLADPGPVGRAAALALRMLGSDAGSDRMARILASDVPDVQLLGAAASAHAKIPGWENPVRPLLQAADPLTRLRAAELLLELDPTEARRVLTVAADDANSPTRELALRILEGARPYDVALLRRHLNDASPIARAHAAGAILAAAGPSSTLRPGR